jgi:hypothetical protein
MMRVANSFARLCWFAPRQHDRANFIGMSVISVFFSLLQAWASLRVIHQIEPGSLADGTLYIRKGIELQFPQMPLYERTQNLLEYGFYPKFLSVFDWQGVPYGASDVSAHPKLIVVFFVQALLLAASTALLLFLAFRLSPGGIIRRMFTTSSLGLLLISPMVVIWPALILIESLTITALLFFIAVCLAYDVQRHCSLMLIGVACCVLVFTRDPMIYFVWIFAILLSANAVLARPAKRIATLIGVVVLILAVVLGGTRTVFFSSIGRYTQNMVNIIQLRMLPDPVRRAYYVDHGLPLSPEVEQLSGHLAWEDNTLFLPDDMVSSDYLAYRNWVAANGTRIYIDFLLTHPGYVLHSIFHNPNLGSYGGDYYFSISDILSIPLPLYRADLVPYPTWLSAFLLAPFGWVLTMLYVAAVFVRFVYRTIWRQNVSSLEIAALAASAAVLISYFTDAWDFWRHSLPFVFIVYASAIVRVPEIVGEWIGLAVQEARSSGPH